MVTKWIFRWDPIGNAVEVECAKMCKELQLSLLYYFFFRGGTRNKAFFRYTLPPFVISHGLEKEKMEDCILILTVQEVRAIQIQADTCFGFVNEGKLTYLPTIWWCYKCMIFFFIFLFSIFLCFWPCWSNLSITFYHRNLDMAYTYLRDKNKINNNNNNWKK